MQTPRRVVSFFFVTSLSPHHVAAAFPVPSSPHTPPKPWFSSPSLALAPSPTTLGDGAAPSYPKPHCGACGFIFFISLTTSNRVTLVLCLGKANSGCPSLGVTLPGHTQWVWGRQPWGCGAGESGAWGREPWKPSLVFHVEPRPRSGVDLGRDTVPAWAWSGPWDTPHVSGHRRDPGPSPLQISWDLETQVSL